MESDLATPKEVAEDQPAVFSAPDLLGDLQGTIKAVKQLPSWFPSAESLLSGTKDAAAQGSGTNDATTRPAGADEVPPPAPAPDTTNLQDKIGQKVIKRVTDSPDPIGELNKALTAMDKLQEASITRRDDGKHKIDMHFDQSTTAPPIKAKIRGFRPGATKIDEDISFTLSHSPNGVKIEDMEGFSGSVRGPLGKSRPTWTNGMHITRDEKGRPCVDIDSTMQGPFRKRESSNRFYEHNFPENSPIRTLMQRPDALSELAGALRMFQSTDDVTKASIRRSGNGSFEVMTEAKNAKHIELNQKLPDSPLTVKSIDLDKTLSGTISHDTKGARLSDLKGMTVQLKTPLGEMAVTPRKVGLETNKDGEPVVRIEVEYKGAPLPFEVPVSKLKKAAAR